MCEPNLFTIWVQNLNPTRLNFFLVEQIRYSTTKLSLYSQPNLFITEANKVNLNPRLSTWVRLELIGQVRYCRVEKSEPDKIKESVCGPSSLISSGFKG